jgi:hypothetical protein
MEKRMSRKIEERKKELSDRKMRILGRKLARKIENGEMKGSFSFYSLRKVI